MTARTLPAVGAPPRLEPLDIKTHTYANGLMLAVVERRDLPIVDVEIVIRAGAAYDEPAKAGRASMVAEMLDEGTAQRDVMQIAEEIDYLGAHLTTSAGWDTTMLALHVLSTRLYTALDIVADVLLNPVFPPDEFERKKRERLTALLQDRDEARVIANKALARGVFGAAHPFGSPAAGTYASLQALTLDDVRQYYTQHFHAANAFIVLAGDIEFEAAVREIGARFGSWPAGTSTAAAMQPTVEAVATRVLLVDKPRAAQAEIRVGHIAPSRDTPDYFPLVVLNTMLGGAFTSRLNLRLREEMGVTYGASSRLGWRRGGGLFYAGSAVDTDAAAESVAVVLQEMKRLRDEPVPGDELQRAMQYIAYGLPRSFETTEDVAAHVREQLLHGLPADYWSTYVDRILAVTADEVASVAARHLQPERAIAVVVADRHAVEAELEQQNIGEVIITDVAT